MMEEELRQEEQEQIRQGQHAGMRPSVTAPDEAAGGDGDE